MSSKQQILLLAADLDGTLLVKTQVSEVNRQAVQEVIDHGIQFVPVSARAPFGIVHALRGIEGYRYLIALNGAYVIDRLSGEVLYDRPMPEGVVRALLALIREHHLYAGYYYRNEFYAEQDGEAAQLESSYQGKLQTFVPDLMALAPGGAHKIIAIEMHNPHLLAHFYEEGIRRIPELNFTYSSDLSVEIVHKQISKGAALEFLAGHLGIPRQAILAIGDSENDLDMIRFAGVGVAVEDALESVRAAADLVVGRCTDDGVAQAIRELVLPAT